MGFNELSPHSALPASSVGISAKEFSLYELSKRLLDIFFSLTVLVCGLPVFVLLALLIKGSSPGPVFYCSKRMGKEGKLFTCWKFRSMYCDAEHRLTQLLAENPHYRKEWKKYFKLKEDPRLTRVGKFLRKTSLDEFPQFWNVFVGDLSLVGPRPFLPNELNAIKRVIGERTSALFSVKPGITGIWQTSGRSSLSFEQRVLLDLNYIHLRSFLFDVMIILKTIPMLILPKGAY
jgi:undecaprenyl-phosphate galactose phosphotransferase